MEAFSLAMNELQVDARYHQRLFGLFDCGNGQIDPVEFCDVLDNIVNTQRGAVYRSCFNLFDPTQQGRRSEIITADNVDAARHNLNTTKNYDAFTQPNLSMVQLMAKLVSSQTNQTLSYDDFQDAVSGEPALLVDFVPHVLSLIAMSEGNDTESLQIRVAGTSKR